MRWLGKFLFVFLITIFLLLICWQMWPVVKTLLEKDEGRIGERIARTVFESRDQQALKFSITTNDGWCGLRPYVVTQGNGPAEAHSLSVEITLRDKNDKTIRVFDHFMELPANRENSLTQGRLDSDSNSVVWRLPPHWIDLSEGGLVGSIEIRTKQKSPAISRVLWRLYKMRSLSADDAKLRYKQLSRKIRDNMAEKFVSPLELLPEKKKYALFSNQFEPVGPSGRLDVNFYRHQIYFLDNDEDEKRPVKIGRTSGLAISNDKRISFRLEHDTTVRFFSDTKNIALHFYSNDGNEVVLPSILNNSERQLKSGYYEITSVQNGNIRVIDTADDSFILPNGLRSQWYSLSPAHPLSYQITKPNNSASIKARLRIIGLDTQTSKLKIKAYDKVHALLIEREVTIKNRTSFYNRYGNHWEHAANLANLLLIDLPINTDKLELYSDHKAFVQLATKPKKPLANSASWFVFQPEHNKYLEQILVLHQPRPPKPRSAELGTTTYIAMTPLNQAAFSHVLKIATDGIVISDPNSSSLQSVTKKSTVYLGDANQATRFIPQLVYERDNTAPSKISYRIASGPWQALWLTGRVGSRNLGPMSKGSYAFEISGADNNSYFWLSHGKHADAWLRRAWHIANTQALKYRVHHNGIRTQIFMTAYSTSTQAIQSQSLQITALHPDGKRLSQAFPLAADNAKSISSVTSPEIWHTAKKVAFVIDDRLDAGMIDIELQHQGSGELLVRAVTPGKSSNNRVDSVRIMDNQGEDAYDIPAQ
jgi:hypothetical protein